MLCGPSLLVLVVAYIRGVYIMLSTAAGSDWDATAQTYAQCL